MNWAHITQCTVGLMYTHTLIEIIWSDLTFKQQSSRIYRSASTPVLLLSRPECSEVAMECLQSGKSGNFLANVKYDQKNYNSVQGVPAFRDFRIRDARYFVILFQASIS